MKMNFDKHDAAAKFIAIGKVASGILMASLAILYIMSEIVFGKGR